MTVVGSVLTLSNPRQSIHGTPPVAVQIRNYSPWVLQTFGGGQEYLVDPYTALTIPMITSGANVVVNPIYNAYPSYPQGYLDAEWMVDGESASSPDGIVQTIQTVSVASKNPLPVSDGSGPYSGLVVACAAGLTVTVLAAPASGTMNRLREIQIVANTTVAAATFMRVYGTSSNASLLTTYPTANGTAAATDGDIPVTEQINASNASAVSMNVHVWYRNEPIQP